MAITVNGQILRNLPEQVSKNTEDVIELQEQSNNYGIRITALEGDAIALATFEDCTFTGTTTIGGDIVQTAGDCSLYGDVSIGGALTVSGASSFAGISASGNASIGGNLSVTGKVSGGEIVENMSGYTFTAGSITGLAISKVYAGAVKNGNKLTIVFAVNLNRSGSGLGSSLIGTFLVPAAVASKLSPTMIGGYNALDFMFIPAVYGVNSTETMGVLIQKSLNDINIVIQGGTVNNLPLNTDAYLRVEATFLLSDPL